MTGSKYAKTKTLCTIFCISIFSSLFFLSPVNAFGLLDELVLTNNGDSHQFCTGNYSQNWYDPIRRASSQGNSYSYYPQQFEIYQKYIKSGLPFTNRFVVFKESSDDSKARVLVNYNNRDKYKLYLRSTSQKQYFAQVWDIETNEPVDFKAKTLPFNNKFENWQDYDFIGFDIYPGLNNPGGQYHDCGFNKKPIHLGGGLGVDVIYRGKDFVINVFDRIFLSNFPLKYDNDYDGPYPQEFYNPKPQRRPSFNYRLKNNKLEAQVYNQAQLRKEYFDKMHVRYELVSHEGGEHVVDSKTLKPGEVYSYDFTAGSPHTDYWLAVSYFKGENQDDEYDFIEHSVKIDYKGDLTEINGDADNFSGSGGLNQQKPQFEYENCEAVDIACHLRNFGTKIREIFTYFFIPSTTAFADDFNSLLKNMTQKLGFLGQSVEMLVGSLKSISAVSPTCSLSFSGQGSALFHGGFKFDLCTLHQQFPKLFEVAFMIIRGSLVFSLVFMINRKLKGVLQ